MALAQRRVPYAYQRPAAWRARPQAQPAPGPVVVPRARIVLPAVWYCVSVAFTVAGIAATYIHGDARMVAATHQRIAIQRITSQLLTRRQRLHAEVIHRTSNSSIAAWACAHGMEPAGGDAVLVYSNGQ